MKILKAACLVLAIALFFKSQKKEDKTLMAYWACVSAYWLANLLS